MSFCETGLWITCLWIKCGQPAGEGRNSGMTDVFREGRKSDRRNSGGQQSDTFRTGGGQQRICPDLPDKNSDLPQSSGQEKSDLFQA